MSKIDLKTFAERYGGEAHPENEMNKEVQAVVQALRECRAALIKYQLLGAYDKETDAFNNFAAKNTLSSLDARFDFGEGGGG